MGSDELNSIILNKIEVLEAVIGILILCQGKETKDVLEQCVFFVEDPKSIPLLFPPLSMIVEEPEDRAKEIAGFLRKILSRRIDR